MFKLIEVINEYDVIEHISFVFPYYTYKGSIQELYFNTNHKLMLERLDDNRVFLYKQQYLEGN